MSKSCPQEIKDSVLENRNFDINQLPIAYFSENKNSEELRDQFIKNRIKKIKMVNNRSKFNYKIYL